MLYKEDLDSMGCSSPGCDHTAHDGLFLHSSCHPEVPLRCEYREGHLNITCSKCKKLVCILPVEHREDFIRRANAQD